MTIAHLQPEKEQAHHNGQTQKNVVVTSFRPVTSSSSHMRCRLDGPIRANRFADSRASPDSRESIQGIPELNPFSANRANRG